MLLFPVGIPCFYLAFMAYYGVPRLAEHRLAAAWLQVALNDAWQRDVLSREVRKAPSRGAGL